VQTHLSPIRYVHIIDIGDEHSASVFIEHFEHWTIEAPNAEPPHRHNFHEILLFESGTGTHQIDARTIDIAPQAPAGTLAYISQGQVHHFTRMHNLTGYMICFADDFLHAASTSLPGPSDPQHDSLALSPSEREGIRALFVAALAEYTDTDDFGKYEVLRHLIQALLIHIERAKRMGTATAGHDRQATSTPHAFMNLLEQHYTQHHDVAFYAGVLGLSAAQLGRALQVGTGKTTKALILDRALLEARRLLHFTTLSIKSISQSLGYDDALYFSKAFKRHAGLSPQEYRNARRK